MSRHAVELRIAGQTVRVVSSATEHELERLAEIVRAKVRVVAPGLRAHDGQAVVLAAIALAHEVEAERERRLAIEAKARETLRSMLARIDDALADDGHLEDHGAARSG